MIDFRYHLVSLVSVFLALAVGIVLGAGPLKDPIGNSLTDSVNSLRQEKDNLRDSLNTTQAAVQHRDDFLTAETPTLVADQLVGRSIVIITLPGVKNDDIAPLATAIGNAGGTVTGSVSIGSDWVDPDQATTRDKAVSDLAVDLPLGSSATASDSSQPLAALLASALVGSGTGHTSPTSALVLKRLRSDDLIGTKGDLASLANAALLLAPANAEVDGNVKATPDTADGNASYVTLANAFDTYGGGTVVSGPGSAALGSGVLAAIRKNDPSKTVVSTVDTGETPVGVITAVLALRQQLDGFSAAYGFVGGGTSMLPTPNPSSSSVPSPSIPSPSIPSPSIPSPINSLASSPTATK